jgi:hypothetical protein
MAAESMSTIASRFHRKRLHKKSPGWFVERISDGAACEDLGIDKLSRVGMRAVLVEEIK